jgi:hypothetical protein
VTDPAKLASLRADPAALEAAVRDAGGEIVGGRVRCPFHDDNRPSASIRESDGVWRFRCHAACDWGGDVLDVVQRADGCTFAEALAKLGGGGGNGAARRTKKPKKPTRLFPTAEAAALGYGLGPPSRMFPYERGEEVVGYIARWDAGPDRAEKIIWRVARRGDGWVQKGMDDPQPLYHGREALADDRTLLWLEGEGICDTARALGVNAITTVGGKDQVGRADWAATKDRDLVCWPDAVDGIEAANDIATLRHKLNPNVTTCIIDPASIGLTDKGDDLAEWLADRGNCADEDLRAQLDSIVASAKPWHPSVDKGASKAVRRSGPIVVCMADVQPERVNWLWPDRIARGAVTLLVGDPGLGKSMLTVDLAARVSSGTAWPDDRDTPQESGDVVILSAEDDPSRTIRPRLDAAGADVSRIRLLAGVRTFDPKSPDKSRDALWTLEDVAALDVAIRDTPDCKLVIIDPVSAYMGGTDSHTNSDVRALLYPLSELARERDVAIVAVTHLRKGEGSALHRSIGSVAFVASARAAWVVAKDREDDTGRRRLLLSLKNNLSEERTGLAFYIARQPFTAAASVSWLDGEVSRTADEVLAAGPRRGDGGKAAREAEAWLRAALAEGPVVAAALESKAEAEGVTVATLRRAKKACGVKSRRVGAGGDGGWVWALPDQPATKGAQDDQPDPLGTDDLSTFGFQPENAGADCEDRQSEGQKTALALSKTKGAQDDKHLANETPLALSKTKGAQDAQVPGNDPDSGDDTPPINFDFADAATAELDDNGQLFKPDFDPAEWGRR